jgi:hypothetical protein
MLMLYEFSHANKAFSLALLRSKSSGPETSFGLFLSLSSYLATQQSRSLRATLYSRLVLLTIRNLIDDSSLMALLQHEDTKSRIRICRQRQPFLPVVSTERKLVEGILDTIVSGIDHNLRRRLDVEFYMYSLGFLYLINSLLLAIISKIIQYNGRTRVRLGSIPWRQKLTLAYHWNELWRSLLGLLKFLVARSEDLADLNNIGELVNNLVDVLVMALTGGETFLPGPTDYDDLFYKLVQATSSLEQYSQICSTRLSSLLTFRLWKTCFSWDDDVIKCMSALPILDIRTSKNVKIPALILGGRYKGN